MGIMVSNGTISGTRSGNIRLCASFKLLHSEPAPTSKQGVQQEAS